ncbi:hypothetical protein, partial [Nonomuraea sp. NPDC059022]
QDPLRHTGVTLTQHAEIAVDRHELLRSVTTEIGPEPKTVQSRVERPNAVSAVAETVLRGPFRPDEEGVIDMPPGLTEISITDLGLRVQ